MATPLMSQVVIVTLKGVPGDCGDATFETVKWCSSLSSTVTLAVALTNPAAVAVMVTPCEPLKSESSGAVTAKLTPVWPAGMVTDEGTVKRGWLETKKTVTFPDSVPAKLSVTDAGPAPSMTEAG